MAQDTYIRRMIINFKKEVEGTLFKFVTMNILKLQLFQVYVMHDSNKVRFHMQRGDENKFHITDMQACPQIYRGLESRLSDLILENGSVD